MPSSAADKKPMPPSMSVVRAFSSAGASIAMPSVRDN